MNLRLMKKQHESTVITFANDENVAARKQLFEMFKNYPGTDEEKERCLGLFIRASLLARLFGIRELYEQIVNLPGIIIDLGTWRGQTAVLCENLRAIFEPLHFQRKIVCFDTFAGYQGFSDKDQTTELHRNGSYNVGADYANLLNELLILHEKNNAMGHNHGKHTVIKGDCRRTLPQFFKKNNHAAVALAFFDVNSYQPTWKAFQIIFERLVPNGIIALWQLTQAKIPAEGRIYMEKILNHFQHTLKRSHFYPGLCYLIKK